MTKDSFLAINTCGLTQVLLKDGGEFLYFSTLERQAASTMLLDKVNQMLTEKEVDLSKLKSLAVCVGPGSFTGIRVGVSAVRALGFALNKPIIPVTYFDILAYEYYDKLKNSEFFCVLDGKSGVCYVKKYNGFKSEKNKNNKPFCAKNSDLRAILGDKTVVADSVFDPILSDCLLSNGGSEGFCLAIKNGIEQNYLSILPLYLRKSQPERGSGDI